MDFSNISKHKYSWVSNIIRCVYLKVDRWYLNKIRCDKKKYPNISHVLRSVQKGWRSYIKEFRDSEVVEIFCCRFIYEVCRV